MRIQIALFAAFILAAPAYSLEIDITDDPNRGFFVGYQHFYKRLPNGVVCSVMWAQSRSGHEYLSLPDACKDEGISKEQIYQDAVDKMQHLKATTDFKSFAEYFKHESVSNKPTKQEIRLRCLDTHSGTYLFLPAEAHNKPGWYYLDKLHNGGRLRTSIVGYWQETASGNLIADFGMNTVNVNMANVYAC